MTNPGRDMDILIIHDFFFSIGGAEWDAIKMARHFDAPIATCDPPTDEAFEDITFINLGNAERYPFGIRELKVWFKNLIEGYRGSYNEYDAIVINKDWSKSAARVIDVPTLYYCHSPDRHLYDLHEFRYEWLRKRSLPKAVLFKILTSLMRPLDQGDIDDLDRIICNSENVRNRCRQYYGIEPGVIYPPVSTDEFYFEEVGDYWLNVSRLGPGKRIEFLIGVFNKTDETLKIVGAPDREEYYRKYRATANDNIEFLGGVSWEQLKRLYARSKGLVTVAKDEDFGLTPVESMASGKPVVAVDEGGYKETVIDGETGWLLPLNQERFLQKIQNLEKSDIRARTDTCMDHSSEFNERHFYRQLSQELVELTNR